jgi:Gpi18-like mannosyltransferase
MKTKLYNIISYDSIKNLLTKYKKKFFILALIVKIGTSFFYGTQDVEWWKAWFSSIEKNGITNVYGKSDSVNLTLLNRGYNIEEITKKSQNVIFFEPKNYNRKEYVVTQPPIYLYHLLIAGKLYKILNPNLSNNRLYNFFLNLFPLFYNFLITLSIYLILKRSKYYEIASITALFFFINPLIILNSPIQGFWDPILGFFILISFYFLYEKKLTLSLLFYMVAILTKPTGIIVSPLFIYIIITEYRLIYLLKSIFITFIIASIILSPFIFSDHFISMLLGVKSILNSSQDISRQSLNFWWPFQYYFNYSHSNLSNLNDLFFGQNFEWYNDFPTTRIKLINLKLISFILFTIATIINILNTRKHLKKDRFYIYYFAFIQCYVYFMLRIGVQNNHYFIMIIFYSLIIFFSKEAYYKFFILLLLFFIQDFIFYGFGRDFSHMISVLTILHLPIFTVFLSIFNILFFLKFLIKPVKL